MASSGSRLAAAMVGAGIAVWLAASCGPTEVVCGPGTCDGCCEGGACVALGSQAFTRCGKAGAACRACVPGQICINGGCELDPNRPPIITPEPPRKDSGTSVCGQITQPCCTGVCAPGLQCNGAVCVAPPTDAGSPDSGTPDAGAPDGGPSLKALGEPCQAGAECGMGQCAQGPFLQGYCTRTCATSGDCGPGGTCGLDPRDALGNTRICFKGCGPAGTAGGCRTGYVCEARVMENAQGGCYPTCAQLAACPPGATCDGRGFCCGLVGFACCNGTTCQGTATCGANLYCQASPQDAGTVPAPTGSACMQGSQCDGGGCIAQEPAGTASCPTAPCWPQGYCTQTCSGAAPCAAGSTCSVLTSSGRNLCMDECAFDGGPGDCRTGYVCDRYWALDGTDRATCYNACATGQDCPGQTDCTNGFCCGDILYACCAGRTCPFGGVCGADGYCH